jgi:hypothetical protein
MIQDPGSLKEVVERLKYTVDSAMAEAALVSSKLKGSFAIDEAYKKVLKLEKGIKNDSNPANRIKLIQELTDLMKTL